MSNYRQRRNNIDIFQHRILQHWVTSKQLCENDQFWPCVAYENVAYKRNLAIIATVKIFEKNCKNKLLNRRYMK